MSRQSGWMLERPGGRPGSFDLLAVCPASGRGVAHLQCEAAAPFTWPECWREASRILSSSLIQPAFGAALIRSSYGNLEAVVASKSGLLAHYWYCEQAGWRGPAVISAGQAAGPPAFLQSPFGNRGNFEVVVPCSGGGLRHFWRDNDRGATVIWHEAANRPFGTAQWSGVALICSSSGSLEMVGIFKKTLYFLKQNGAGGNWTPAQNIAGDVAGRPAFLQSDYGAPGDFDVVAAGASGGLKHLWRNNNLVLRPWSAPTPIGPASVQFDDVSMFQSSSGGLELAARVPGSGIYMRFRRAAPDSAWEGPFRGPSIECDT